MDKKNMTTGLLTGIDYDMHSKLTHDCQVVMEDCFKLPLPPSALAETETNNSNITIRRQSLRLQEKGVQCMKESKLKKFKRKAKKLLSNDNKESLTFLVKTSESSDSTSNSQNFPNQLELSDNEIMELLNNMTSFIEDGTWTDSSTDTSDLNLLCLSNSTSFNQSSTHSPGSADDESSKVIISNNSGSAVLEMHGTMLTSGAIDKGIQSAHEKSIQPSLCQMQASSRSISTETDLIVQCSISTQTDFDNQLSASTQHSSVTSTDCSTQANSSNATVAPVIKSSRDSKRHASKRKASFGTPQPNQIFIRNYDLNNCSVNRKVHKYKIPKPKTSNNDVVMNSGHPSVPNLSSIAIGDKLPQHQMGATMFLKPASNFDSMKESALTLLQRPCYKFLKQENCGLFCPENHFLPSAAIVAETVDKWSSEMIHFFYVNYIQRFMMCHLMYFEVVCNVFVNRRLSESLLATVKDCERLSMEGNIKIIWLCLIKCGYTEDDALFGICTHAFRFNNTVNEILKIITTFNVVNFKRTIAFVATEVDTYDFDPGFGNEVLRQACEVATLDVTLLEFCSGIIRKFHSILDQHYMRMLLLKCKIL